MFVDLFILLTMVQYPKMACFINREEAKSKNFDKVRHVQVPVWSLSGKAADNLTCCGPKNELNSPNHKSTTARTTDRVVLVS